MTKHYRLCDCSRWVIDEGSKNRIEAALDATGEPTVLAELETLLTSSEAEMNQRVIDLSVVIDTFLNRPLDLRKNELNWLYEEIWEIKFGVMRLAFTSARCLHAGQGKRLVLADHVRAPQLNTNTARATSLFVKNDESTPRHEIRRATAIAREDRSR